MDLVLKLKQYFLGLKNLKFGYLEFLSEESCLGFESCLKERDYFKMRSRQHLPQSRLGLMVYFLL